MKTVAPVVVSPDIASKKASVKSAPGAPSMKGRQPKSGSATQTSAVSRKACWRLSPVSPPRRVTSTNICPIDSARKADRAKPRQFSLPSAQSSAIGTSIDAPRIMVSRPMTETTGRRSYTRGAPRRGQKGTSPAGSAAAVT